MKPVKLAVDKIVAGPPDKARISETAYPIPVLFKFKSSRVWPIAIDRGARCPCIAADLQSRCCCWL